MIALDDWNLLHLARKRPVEMDELNQVEGEQNHVPHHTPQVASLWGCIERNGVKQSFGKEFFPGVFRVANQRHRRHPRNVALQVNAELGRKVLR